MGLMLGFETKHPAKETAARCLENGVLVLTAKNKIRLVPPLIISEQEINTALDRIFETL